MSNTFKESVTNSAASGQESAAGCYEHDNEPSGLIKFGESFEYLCDY
jgi:hypothetical protein